MRTCGIICECNPLHAGHRHLIAQARLAGAEAIVCVMSGYFTQRGEAAVLDPRVRARMLLRAGADAVLELPFPYCTAPGEQFAAAGVSVLSRLGVDELWFGSESGNIGVLRTAAGVTGSAAFVERYRASVRSGRGTAAAYADCLREFLGDRAPAEPNDLLALCYLRALEQSGNRMTAHTVRRIGAGYHGGLNGEAPSATALRKLLIREGADALEPYLSASDLALLRDEVAAGRAPADVSRLSSAVLACLRTMSPERAEGIATLGGGLGRRLTVCARECADSDGLLSAAGGKYPLSRLRRGVLFALTGTAGEDLRTAPAYAVLLAANPTGCRFLAQTRKTREIPVVTKRADLPHSPEAERQARFAEKACGLWSLCLPEPVAPAELLRSSALIDSDRGS